MNESEYTTNQIIRNFHCNINGLNRGMQGNI